MSSFGFGMIGGNFRQVGCCCHSTHDVGLWGRTIVLPVFMHTCDLRSMSYVHFSHVQQHTNEKSLSVIEIWVFAICFLSMYHPTADDDLIVVVWLCFRDAIIPQPGSGHAELLRREIVKYGGD